jgi:glucokinase
MNYCIAVDIGGTKIALGLFDQTGRLHGQVRTFPVPFDDYGVADPQGLLQLMRPLLEEVRHNNLPLCGLGLSICGNIDPNTGEAVLVPNLHWRNLPFGQMANEAFGLSTFAATDVRQALLAEHMWGAARGLDYFAWCTIGTGYGGYLFLDGKPYDGYHKFAGPFGHATFDEINGYPCGCGRRGCVETYVAGPAIARAGQAAVEAGCSPMMADLAAGEPLTTHVVFQAYRAGDAEATRIIDQAVRLICISLSSVNNLLDLQMIVLGGGVVKGLPELVDLIDDKIRAYLLSEEAKRDLRIVQESFSNASLFGSAAHAFIQCGLPIIS